MFDIFAILFTGSYLLRSGFDEFMKQEPGARTPFLLTKNVNEGPFLKGSGTYLVHDIIVTVGNKPCVMEDYKLEAKIYDRNGDMYQFD